MSLTINTLPLAAVVKEATQRQHSAVEEMLLPKLSSVQSREDYASILRMFYGYYQPLERCIDSHITTQQLPDIAERRKADAILKDLQFIGQSTGNILLCRNLPPVQTMAQAFGALYVLEGSTLGGMHISKMLRKNIHLSLTEDALGFFAGYRDQTGSKWKTFLEVFNRQSNAATIVQSANDTFYHLNCWMQQSLAS